MCVYILCIFLTSFTSYFRYILALSGLFCYLFCSYTLLCFQVTWWGTETLLSQNSWLWNSRDCSRCFVKFPDIRHQRLDMTVIHNNTPLSTHAVNSSHLHLWKPRTTNKTHWSTQTQLGHHIWFWFYFHRPQKNMYENCVPFICFVSSKEPISLCTHDASPLLHYPPFPPELIKGRERERETRLLQEMTLVCCISQMCLSGSFSLKA